MSADLIDLPAGKQHAHYVRFRRAQAQKVARAMRDDPGFNWRGLGKTCANDLLYLPSGRYRLPDGSVLPWGSPNAAAILCHGKNAPFESLEAVPPNVLEQVEAGVADALTVGAHVIEDGLIVGRRLAQTDSMRRALRVWLLWPADMSRAEFEGRRDNRGSKAAVAKREKRRAAGMKPREQYEGESIAAMARAIGVKPDTLRARLRRAPPVPSHVASVSDTISKDSLCVDRPATKRDTIAGQARALGLKPDTLRKRLRRAAREAPPQSGARRPASIVYDHAINNPVAMTPAEAFDDYCRRMGVTLHPDAREHALEDIVWLAEDIGEPDALSDESFEHFTTVHRTYAMSPEEVEALEAAA